MAPSSRARRGSAHPIPGRERERILSHGVGQLQAGSSVLLLGDGGVGKTHVGNILLHSLLQAGHVVSRMRGSGGRGILWSGLTASPAEGAPTVRLLEATTSAVDDALQTIGATRPVVFVDDAHLLDVEIARWLCGLVADSRILLLATLAPHQGGDPRATELLTQLWLEDLAVRIDLAPLDLAQTEMMIASHSDRAAVDHATRLAIFHASGGSPLMIREIMRDVREHGVRAGTTASIVFPLSPTQSMRIQAVVAHRTRVLAPQDAVALWVMARLDGVPLERAIRYIGNDTVRRLVALGFLSVNPAGTAVTPAQRLDAESIAATLETADIEALSRSAAREMVLAHRAGVMLQPLEYVFIAEAASAGRLDATVALETGAEPIDCPSRAQEWAEICLIAATKSMSMGALYGALTLARESVSSHPTVNGIVEESRVQAGMGNYAAAASTLDQLHSLDPAAYSRDTALRSLRWRVSLSTWITDPVPFDERVDAVRHQLTPQDAHDILALGEAMEATLSTEWSRAAELLAPLVESAESHPANQLAAAGMLALSHARLGRGAELAAAVRAGRRLVTVLAPGTRLSENLLDRREINHFYSSLSMAQLTAGADVREVSAGLGEAMDLAIQRRDFGHVPIIGMLLGYVEFWRGDLELAETEFRLAWERLTVVPDSRWQLWIAGLRARALALSGRSAEASEVIETTASLPWREYPLRDLVVAWSRLDVGDRPGAPSAEVGAVLELARAVDAKTSTATLDLLFQAVERGADAASLAPRVRELREETDLTAFRAMADTILGIADDDPEAVDDAAEVLADAEYLAFARSAALRASAMYATKGRRVAAAASLAFAEALTADADGTVSMSREIDALDELTPREREIVLLVSSGMSNREIAARLFLSVRTVESHFYQARVKLGAPSRRELSAQLRTRRTDY